MTIEQIGDLARRQRVAVYELTALHASLEDAYMALTRGTIEFDAGRATP